MSRNGESIQYLFFKAFQKESNHNGTGNSFRIAFGCHGNNLGIKHSKKELK